MFKDKKFLVFLSVAAVILGSIVIYIVNRPDPIVTPKASYFNFDSTNIADYEYIMKTYDSSKYRVSYFESQGKLAKPVYEATDGKCIWIKSVFAVEDTVIFFIHDTAYADVKIEKINSYWLEDQVITPYVKVSLDAAIDSLQRVDIIKPKSPVFVIRRPLYPPFPDHSYYIFGDFGHSPFIQVDSNTGEVRECQF